jgi:hypothetical protein
MDEPCNAQQLPLKQLLQGQAAAAVPPAAAAVSYMAAAEVLVADQEICNGQLAAAAQ